MGKKIMTKPKFLRIFGKRLIIGLVISTILCTAALVTASVVYKNIVQKNAEMKFSQIQSHARIIVDSAKVEAGSSADTDKLIAKLDMELQQFKYPDTNSGYGINTAIRLVDTSGNTVCDTYDKRYLVVTDLTKNEGDFNYKTYYLCDPQIAQKVDEKLSEYDRRSREMMDGDSDVLCYPRCTKACLKGRYFYPFLSLESIPAKSDVPRNYMKYTRHDFTDLMPEDASEYYFVDNEENVSALNIIMSDLDKDRDEKHDKLEKLLDEQIKSSDGDTVHGLYMQSDHIQWKDLRGHPQEYILYYAVSDSFFNEFTFLTVLCAAGLVLAAILTALIISVVTYSRRKTQYEIFTYRRDTTNAMAHDLKVPLTAISGYSEMLREDINPEKQKHYLEMISGSVSQMNRIVTDILELSKTESDVNKLDIRPLNVNEICTGIVTGLETAFSKKDMTCTVTGEEKQIKADEKLFTQAVTNLIYNALVYSKQGSDVIVAVSDKELRIENTPQAMPEKSPEELLKPFVKDKSYRGENSGSGVGLAIAKHDLERMGSGLKIETTEDRFIASIIFRA